MRHGRKSRSMRFNGYKEHIARDLDLPIIVGCSVTPANRPEEEGVGDHDEARGNDEAQRSARSAGGGDEVNGRHMRSAISTERGRR
jgi:hypothetical protein